LPAALGVLTLLALPGCIGEPPPRDDTTPAPTIVLTFDDGPLPADLPAPPGNDDAALAPLRAVLAALAANDAEALFYIKGPGSAASAGEFATTFATALAEIHAAGHQLGYHAFDHADPVWRQPLWLPLATELMSADLERLEGFLDTSLAGADLSREDVFAPVFRQPFGGLTAGQMGAQLAAAQRGWTVHGYAVDSGDWIVNADAPAELVALLPAKTDAERVAYVRGRLRCATRRQAGRDVIDVLCHVNSFTAAHLPEFLQELRTAFAGTNGPPLTSAGADKTPPTFAVPDSYLPHDDPAVDVSTIADLLLRRCATGL